MKPGTVCMEILLAACEVFALSACDKGTPGETVRTAMETEIVKEKAEEYLEENNVPAVVVKEFFRDKSDTIKRQWLVYKRSPEEEINLALPAVYIVRYSVDDEQYRAKYSREGEILETNHLINLSVLPFKALETVKDGKYKDWKVVGDVLEVLDNATREPAGYVVTVEKRGDKERLFFNREGDVVKIQELT